MFDTHAHLNLEPLGKEPPEEIVRRAKEQGVTKIINIGIDIASSQQSVALAAQIPEVYAAVGIHPQEAGSAYNDAQIFRELERLLGQKKVVALGEVGLDYYRNPVAPSVQKQVLEWQLRLALENDKPLIVHNRDADEDVYAILKYYKCAKVVFHCYGRDREFTRKLLDLGWLVSFTGNITFPKNRQGQDAVIYTPLDSIMIETDCPFMAPVPHRGQTNEPAFVRLVAEKIAELKGVDWEQVEQATDANARQFFAIGRD
ncbi:hydrolase TatD [Candidatus Termititenax persephonae]|uniref:Hydrolase TatD n=1 Tax=Candidatus Termititenax persephonae TaxID=2218525 RepID=A0A388THG5_9BACT|nr:hydrolase TatD [Candidatus Termititenax persephonae]